MHLPVCGISQTHPKHVGVQAAGCFALRSITTEDSELSIVLADGDGLVETLTAALKVLIPSVHVDPEDYPYDTTLPWHSFGDCVAAAFLVLNLLWTPSHAADEKATERAQAAVGSGVLPMALQVIDAEISEEDVGDEVRLALHTMASHGPTLQQAILDAGFDITVFQPTSLLSRAVLRAFSGALVEGSEA